MIRVLVVVGNSGTICNWWFTPFLFNIFCKVLADSSLPISPNRTTCPPNALTLSATLLAPPGLSVNSLICTIGIGASGEIREASPCQ